MTKGKTRMPSAAVRAAEAASKKEAAALVIKGAVHGSIFDEIIGHPVEDVVTAAYKEF